MKTADTWAEAHLSCFPALLRLWTHWLVHMEGEALHTVHLCHSRLLHVFTHVREKAPRGFLSAQPFLKSMLCTGRCWWLAYVSRVPFACTMTQEFTLCFHRALPSTAALLTRAPRFNYWLWNLISWAAQEIASRRVKVVTGLDSEGNMHIHCSCVHFLLLLLLWCCELLADCVKASWMHVPKAPPGTVPTRQNRRSFWWSWLCLSFHQALREGFFAATEAMRDISGSFYRKVVSTGEFKSYSQFLASLCFPSSSPPLLLSRCLVIIQAKVVQLSLLSLFHP